MKRVTTLALLAIAAMTGAQPPTNSDHKAPPTGLTEADMQACMAAATPGPMHERLAKGVGTWKGACKMWMPGATEPVASECTTTISPMMDGRFVRIESSGEMPGMGPFQGFGLNGFDNVSQKFVMTWADNMGTGMMNGTGELSEDGKTLTWSCSFNCPITKGPMKCRQIERQTGKDTMTVEMFGPDPKTGRDYKMMQIDYTRSNAKAEEKKAVSSLSK